MIEGDNTLTLLMERAMDSWARGNLHTVMPGIVTSFDPGPPVPTVSVQPALQRVYETDEKPVNLTVKENIPVLFPGCDPFVMTFEITEGAPVLLLVSERAYSAWFQSEQPSDPGLDHMFDLSDCFALPGVWPLPRTFGAAVESGEIAIRDLAGTSKIALTATGITKREITAEIVTGESVHISDSGIDLATGGGTISLASSGTVDINGNFEVLP